MVDVIITEQIIKYNQNGELERHKRDRAQASERKFDSNWFRPITKRKGAPDPRKHSSRASFLIGPRYYSSVSLPISVKARSGRDEIPNNLTGLGAVRIGSILFSRALASPHPVVRLLML